jgi:hypothetical protein
VATQTVDNIDYASDSTGATTDSTPLAAVQNWSFDKTVDSDGSISLTLVEENNAAYSSATSTNTVSYPVQVVAP